MEETCCSRLRVSAEPPASPLCSALTVMLGDEEKASGGRGRGGGRGGSVSLEKRVVKGQRRRRELG